MIPSPSPSDALLSTSNASSSGTEEMIGQVEGAVSEAISSGTEEMIGQVEVAVSENKK
jgi:hypothetical protein